VVAVNCVAETNVVVVALNDALEESLNVTVEPEAKLVPLIVMVVPCSPL
jgi:hypothetical protein